MIHRCRCAWLLAVVLISSGCSINTTTTQPAAVQFSASPTPDSNSNPNPDSEPQAAKNLEHDILTLKASWAQGLITTKEYQQAAAKVIEQTKSVYTSLGQSSLTTERLRVELAYLLEMRKQGTLTANQYERARSELVAAFVPSDSTDLSDPPTSQPAK
jgi:hypothetical protein